MIPEESARKVAEMRETYPDRPANNLPRHAQLDYTEAEHQMSEPGGRDTMSETKTLEEFERTAVEVEGKSVSGVKPTKAEIARRVLAAFESYDEEIDNLRAEVTRLQAEVKAWRELCVRKDYATCSICGRSKKPVGRDYRGNHGYCTPFNCKDYWSDPYPVSLWPGECYDAFGCPSSPPEVEE